MDFPTKLLIKTDSTKSRTLEMDQKIGRMTRYYVESFFTDGVVHVDPTDSELKWRFFDTAAHAEEFKNYISAVEKNAAAEHRVVREFVIE